MKKNKQIFLLLWLGQVIATIGHGLSSFALGVVAYQIAGKAFHTSLVMVCGYLPQIFLEVPAGVLADRLDRRLLMILGDGLSALGLVLILLYKRMGSLNLTVILIGVTISSVFSSLMKPAYQASVTDLLDEEDYSKASGLIQLANSVDYLVSPILAGLLLNISSLDLILILDISSLIFTVLFTSLVWKKLKAQKKTSEIQFFSDLKEGYKVLKSNKGVFQLVLISTLMAFSMGFIMSLANPYVLSFADSQKLGRIQSLSATGIIISSLILSIIPIKKDRVNILSLAIFSAGLFMLGFGFWQELTLIAIFGFLFFSCLGPINATLDYLVRANVDNQYQGRIWSFIGFISQIGFVLSFILSGLLADQVFIPGLQSGGFLAGLTGIFGQGAGPAMGLEIMLAGILLAASAFFIYGNPEIRKLDKVALSAEEAELTEA